jgi:hypothetical protein
MALHSVEENGTNEITICREYSFTMRASGMSWVPALDAQVKHSPLLS